MSAGKDDSPWHSGCCGEGHDRLAVYVTLTQRSRTSPARARRWAVAGAACLILAHALFWLLLNPVNQVFAAWTSTAVPPDWTRLRDQWEFTHAARAGLFLLGFCALLAAVLAARSGAERRGETTG